MNLYTGITDKINGIYNIIIFKLIIFTNENMFLRSIIVKTNIVTNVIIINPTFLSIGLDICHKDVKQTDPVNNTHKVDIPDSLKFNILPTTEIIII
ncbi:hypothetical protein AAIB48_01550 [Paraclostridium benzoelyticum]|uniref:hypothetical protein n=1 Tax=Paraclostridium benzoelyticum TaxID=1629550 RepID=UPI0031CD5EA2